MDSTLLVIQILNGLQLGVLLFLLAAGLTLVFGIMDFINLAHGSFYMVGAFFCATLTLWFDSFLLGLLLALPLTLAVGVVVELLVVRVAARSQVDVKTPKYRVACVPNRRPLPFTPFFALSFRAFRCS